MNRCPLCASEQARPFGRVHGRQVSECAACGVTFFPRPIETSADYQQYYPYLQHFDRARFEWELGVRRRRYQHQLARIRTHRPGAHRLADIGAGPGYLCKVAMDQGWDAVGVETASVAIEAGQREYGVRYAPLYELAPASQDAITCHHVLEHIEEPAGFLETVRSKLADGGVLVVHVPNCEPLSYLVRNLLRRQRDRDADVLCQLYYPEHITGFSPRSLPAALARYGFAPIEVRCASLWSPFYDPFFLRNYFRDARGQPVARVDYRALSRQAVQGVIENVGNAVGRGDWVVGHFRAV